MKSILILSSVMLIVSFMLTWATRMFSLKKRIIDIPNERSSHSEPTPRGGGIAIVITWYIGITVMFLEKTVDRSLYFALMSGILLAVFSIIDDIIDLRPYIRIIAQTATVFLALYFLYGIHPVLLFNNVIIPELILFPIAIIGMVWFINLYNFLDGIDGYASVEAIAMALAFYIFTGQTITLILIASVIGFLIWNWPKAKIFMGDVGSTQLGFVIVVLGIYLHNEKSLSIINWSILTAPFWFDASFTLFRRWRNKEKLSQAHRKHIYQRLVQYGYSHLRVDILLTLLNICLIILVLFSSKYYVIQIPVLVLTIAMLSVVAVYTEKRKPF